MTNTRACVRCGQPNDSTDGRVRRCSKCIAYQLEYYKANKEREIARHAEWADLNKQRLAEYQRIRRKSLSEPLRKQRYKKRRLSELAKCHDRYKHSKYMWYYKYKYGLTKDAFQEMYTAHNGRCAICQRTEVELDRRLHIDHCHSTGVVRGLLCHQCNHGLGNFKDDTNLLSSAVAYLLR